MKRSSLFLLLFLPVLSFAQSNFQKGYIVKLSKDTVKGFIDYRESSINPTSLRFKAADGKIDKYTAHDCLAYGVDGLEAFESHKVEISQSRLAFADLTVGPDTSSKIDTVFLKVLQKGAKLSLFVYKDDIKERFFIQTKNDPKVTELIRNVYLSPSDHLMSVVDSKYLRQLQAVTRAQTDSVTADNYEKKLARLAYKSDDLLKISEMINDQKVVEVKNYPKSRFFLGAGFAITNKDYIVIKINSLITKFGANGKPSPYFTAGMDFFLNPAIKKVIFRGEISAVISQNEITTNDPTQASDYSSTEINVALSPQIIYNFYNTEKFKAFFGGGISINYTNLDRKKVPLGFSYNPSSQNTSGIQSTYLTLPISFGITLGKRTEVIANLILRDDVNGIDNKKISIERYKIGYKYLFGK